MKKILKSVSLLLICVLVYTMLSPVATAAGYNAVSKQTEYGDYQIPETYKTEYSGKEGTQPFVDDNGVICIYSYNQLSLIGSEETVEYGKNKVFYSSDGEYRIVCDIPLPRHKRWNLPNGFSGEIKGALKSNKDLYDSDSDTIYIYNPYQLAVIAMDNADEQPVLSGDSKVKTFGTGQPVKDNNGEGKPLTYSGEHNYVISACFDSDTSKKPISVREKKSKLTTGATAKALTGAAQVDGRDFAGQVLKKIDGKTYILIGNESQLRAIGTDKKVWTPIYKMKDAGYNRYAIDTDRNGNPIILYGGDADLLQSQNDYADFTFQ